MSQFDDLNDALAALKEEMKKATTATQAVASLGKAAEAMTRHATTVEARLQACEERMAAIDKSLVKVGQAIQIQSEKTIQQWKEAVAAVLAKTGSQYVDAVTSQVRQAGEGFSESIADFRDEWTRREEALKRAHNWIKTLSIVLMLILLGIVSAAVY